MIVYSYRCPACGPFDVWRPLGSARAIEPCPGCGEGARRVFSSPAFARTPAPVASALARAEASAHEPEVVTRVPPRRARPRVASDPRHAKLPRP